jgi:hypothetical protein
MTRKALATQMAQLMKAEAKSGLSKKAFCAEHNIPVAKFYYWQRRLSQEEQEPPVPAGFTPLSVRPAAELELRLPGGQWISVRTQSSDALRVLLDAIGKGHFRTARYQ